MENEQNTAPKTEKNSLIKITVLQLAAVALIIGSAAILKMCSGGFYRSVSKIYHSATDTKTNISEVISAPKKQKNESKIKVEDKTDEPYSNSASVSGGGDETGDENGGNDGNTENTENTEKENGDNQNPEQNDPEQNDPEQNDPEQTAANGPSGTVDLNAVSVSSSNSIIWPVNGQITSNFGQRSDPINGSVDRHGGLDIAVNTGTPVKAAADGIIEKAESNSFYGNYIIVKHSNSFSTVYGHLSEIAKNEGDRVKKGETIALSGSTGRSTGPHLHFEIRIGGKKTNPLSLLPKNSQV